VEIKIKKIGKLSQILFEPQVVGIGVEKTINTNFAGILTSGEF
jgi:hypothetical protein